VNSRLPLSVAIITLNEEENLPRCLESVRDLVSEIVVIDSGSTDRTREVAEKFGAIFEVHSWVGYAAQKNIALGRCSQSWVLSLDADEAVSDDLAAMLRHEFAAGEPHEDGFFVNRLNFYLGAWIHHTWYPEWRLRLARKKNAKWVGPIVHEKLQVEGMTRKLPGDLLHFPFRDFQDHLQHGIKYARTIADDGVKQGDRFHWYELIFSPWLAFFKRLLLKQGWRDGWRGWLIAFATLVYVFAKYAFVLEKKLLGGSSLGTKNSKP
jgi:glycosyltransferase involved in cell wall biosynthesis